MKYINIEIGNNLALIIVLVLFVIAVLNYPS